MKKNIIVGEEFDYEVLDEQQDIEIMGGELKESEKFEGQFRLTFINARFENCDFRGLDERKANGKPVYLSFKNCSFYNCNFNDSDYGAVLFIHCDFHGCSLLLTRFDLSTLRKVEFYHCDMDVTIHDSIVGDWMKIHYCENAKISIIHKSVIKAHLDLLYSRIEMNIEGESAVCSVRDTSTISHCTLIMNINKCKIVDDFYILYSTVYIEKLKELKLLRASIEASLSEINIKEKEDRESINKFCNILKLDKSDLIKEV